MIIKNINNIEYIKYLNVFVTSLLKILQKKYLPKENKDRKKNMQNTEKYRCHK